LLASPRGEALGSHHAAISEDGIIGGNPADGALSGEHIFLIGYRAPFAGIGSAINIGSAGYLHSFGGFSAGAGWSLLQSDIYSFSDVGLVFSMGFGDFAVGGRARLLFDSYRRGNFDYGEGDVHDDPVFDDGYSKAAFTGDIGASMSLGGRARVGAGALNLLDPDLALENASQSTSGQALFTDFSYYLPSYGRIYSQIVFEPSAPEGGEIAYGLGFETEPIGDALSLRVGIDDRSAALGAGFEFGWVIPLRLDYTFDYRWGNIGKTSTGHSFAIVGRIEPKRKLPDLAIDISLDKDKYAIGEAGIITVDVSVERLKVRNVTADLRLRGELIEELVFDEVEPDFSRSIRVPFVFEREGEHEFTAVVDPSGAIAESNEGNNTATAKARAFAPPQLALSPSPKTLEIAEARYVNQDEAIVPTIFFGEGSAEIDDRFEHLIALMAERLAQNPDARLIIDGFYDPESEPESSELAESRAKAAISAMAKLNPDVAERLSIGDMPPDAQRIPRRSQYAEYQRLVDEENRRAELRVEIPEMSRGFDIAEFGTAHAKQLALSALNTLRTNPMTMLIVRVSERGISQNEAIAQSLRIKSLLLMELPELYRDRVLAGSDEELLEGRGIVFLTGEAIVFHPREIHSALSYEPSHPPDCEIAISIESGIDITSWQIDLVDERTGHSTSLARGESATAKTIRWDWKDEHGGLIPFGRRFSLCLSAEDEFGQSSKLCVDGIGTEVVSREERTDKLLLVQFMFDAHSPQTQYLKDRLEWVARHIIMRAGAEDVAISAEIQGHTDHIGGHRRNLELSRQRAESVEARLLAYIAGLVGTESPEELNRWMAENRVSITSEGYAETVQYSVELWRDGALSEVKLGDNELPEGRAINRRVLIVINEVRGGGGDE